MALVQKIQCLFQNNSVPRPSAHISMIQIEDSKGLILRILRLHSSRPLLELYSLTRGQFRNRYVPIHTNTFRDTEVNVAQEVKGLTVFAKSNRISS
jgi:hypothetical protein